MIPTYYVCAACEGCSRAGERWTEIEHLGTCSYAGRAMFRLSEMEYGGAVVVVVGDLEAALLNERERPSALAREGASC